MKTRNTKKNDAELVKILTEKVTAETVCAVLSKNKRSNGTYAAMKYETLIKRLGMERQLNDVGSYWFMQNFYTRIHEIRRDCSNIRRVGGSSRGDVVYVSDAEAKAKAEKKAREKAARDKAEQAIVEAVIVLGLTHLEDEDHYEYDELFAMPDHEYAPHINLEPMWGEVAAVEARVSIESRGVGRYWSSTVSVKPERLVEYINWAITKRIEEQSFAVEDDNE
jgi:hypothetical protein